MIPETIYIRDHQVFMGHGIYRTEPWDDDIPYDRRKTCVWTWSDRAKAWFTGCHRVEQEKEATAHWCRYCGSRIEITDCDAKGEA